MRVALSLVAWLALSAALPAFAADAAAPAKMAADYQFTFGTGTAPAGWVVVNAETPYTPQRGYGIEANANVPTPGVPSRPAVAPEIKAFSQGIASDKPFIFSAAVPPGNYRVTATLGDPERESVVTIKAEARRLQVEHLRIPRAETRIVSFLVNVRNPEIPAYTRLLPGTTAGAQPESTKITAGTVKLDPREPGSFTWDDKLSLEFCDSSPAVQKLEIHKVDDALTVYLCGDSTVTDQPAESYGSWGQMLPRWFDDKVVVANYAESGETLKAFMKERRWDKVMSLVKNGDYVFMQLGNNDMQTSGHNAMWPADDHDEDWAAVHSDAETDYQTILKDWAAQVKLAGATPVIVSPYTKQRNGAPDPAGLRGYPAAAKKAAADSGTSFLDLNRISTQVLTVLGTQDGAAAYVDGQHTTSYGAYMNARSVTFGIRELKLDLAKDLTADAIFDPAKPAPLHADFDVPLEPRGPGGFRGRGPGRAASAPATRGN